MAMTASQFARHSQQIHPIDYARAAREGRFARRMFDDNDDDDDDGDDGDDDDDDDIDSLWIGNVLGAVVGGGGDSNNGDDDGDVAGGGEHYGDDDNDVDDDVGEDDDDEYGLSPLTPLMPMSPPLQLPSSSSRHGPKSAPSAKKRSREKERVRVNPYDKFFSGRDRQDAGDTPVAPQTPTSTSTSSSLMLSQSSVASSLSSSPVAPTPNRTALAATVLATRLPSRRELKSTMAAAAAAATAAAAEDGGVDAATHDALLCIGAQICFEIRCAVFDQLGFTTSAGVAPNCMLAKMASSVYKPNQQSIVRACDAIAFIHTRPLRDVPGFGPEAQRRVAFDADDDDGDGGDEKDDVVRIGAFARFSTPQLIAKYGNGLGLRVARIAGEMRRDSLCPFSFFIWWLFSFGGCGAHHTLPSLSLSLSHTHTHTHTRNDSFAHTSRRG
jgi:hypothetical protein